MGLGPATPPVHSLPVLVYRQVVHGVLYPSLAGLWLSLFALGIARLACRAFADLPQDAWLLPSPLHLDPATTTLALV